MLIQSRKINISIVKLTTWKWNKKWREAGRKNKMNIKIKIWLMESMLDKFFLLMIWNLSIDFIVQQNDKADIHWTNREENGHWFWIIIKNKNFSLLHQGIHSQSNKYSWDQELYCKNRTFYHKCFIWNFRISSTLTMKVQNITVLLQNNNVSLYLI